MEFVGTRTTYRDLDMMSAALAAEFASRGLTAGDRVAVLAGNRPEYAGVLRSTGSAGICADAKGANGVVRPFPE